MTDKEVSHSTQNATAKLMGLRSCESVPDVVELATLPRLWNIGMQMIMLII